MLRSRYLDVAKLVILAINYAPYLFFLDRGPRMWIMLLAGAYLAAGVYLRNFVLHRRLTTRVALAWVIADTLVWATSMHFNGWDGNYVYLVLGADAAMIGWRHRYGLPYLLIVLAVTLGARALTWMGLRHFMSTFSFPVVVGLLLVHAFVYVAALARREQEETARARHEADLARKQAELANAYLRDYAEQVEELSALRERNRLAREVHDTIAHGFTGIIMQLEAVSLLLEVRPEQAAVKLAALQETARDSLHELRRSVHALRPLQLEERHGESAFAKLVAEFRSATGVEASLTVSGPLAALPVAQELCIYRAVQEGLTNALRHGQAQRVDVGLAYAPGRLILTVEDDGRGITTTAGDGLGLVGVRERAAALGGAVEAGPRPGGGFRLQVMLPAPDRHP